MSFSYFEAYFHVLFFILDRHIFYFFGILWPAKSFSLPTARIWFEGRLSANVCFLWFYYATDKIPRQWILITLQFLAYHLQ